MALPGVQPVGTGQEATTSPAGTRSRSSWPMLQTKMRCAGQSILPLPCAYSASELGRSSALRRIVYPIPTAPGLELDAIPMFTLISSQRSFALRRVAK